MKVWLVCYRNPQTGEWYWLTFGRTVLSSVQMAKAFWGVNSTVEWCLWEGTFSFNLPLDVSLVEHHDNAQHT